MFIVQNPSEEFEDTKVVIRIRISKNNRPHNGQKKKYKMTKTTIYKTKDRVTRTQLKPGVNSGAPEGYAVPAPLVAPVVIHICRF